MDLDEIKQIANNLRLKLESLRNGTDIRFQHFPCGSCYDASLLLKKELSEHSINTVLCKGWSSDGKSHAWLEYMDIIIDITADQFGKDKIIIGKSIWHKKTFK